MVCVYRLLTVCVHGVCVQVADSVFIVCRYADSVCSWCVYRLLTVCVHGVCTGY